MNQKEVRAMKCVLIRTMTIRKLFDEKRLKLRPEKNAL